jgi:hypothetical protein
MSMLHAACVKELPPKAKVVVLGKVPGYPVSVQVGTEPKATV